MIESNPDPAALVEQAIKVLNEPDRTIAEHQEIARELEAAEPALRTSVAGGNVNDAAQLTCNRIRLKESIPAAIAEAEARRMSTPRVLFEATTEFIAEANRVGTELLEGEKKRLDEAVLPVLLPLLKPGAEASVSGYAAQTQDGARAQSLLLTLYSIEADYPRCDAYDLNARSKPVEIDAARRQAVNRANRALAAWRAFTGEQAE